MRWFGEYVEIWNNKIWTKYNVRIVKNKACFLSRLMNAQHLILPAITCYVNKLMPWTLLRALRKYYYCNYSYKCNDSPLLSRWMLFVRYCSICCCIFCLSSVNYHRSNWLPIQLGVYLDLPTAWSYIESAYNSNLELFSSNSSG